MQQSDITFVKYTISAENNYIILGNYECHYYCSYEHIRGYTVMVVKNGVAERIVYPDNVQGHYFFGQFFGVIFCDKELPEGAIAHIYDNVSSLFY